MAFVFEEAEKEQIIKRFGRPFWERLTVLLAKYTKAWRLDTLSLIHSFSANMLFRCRAEAFGDAILKICVPWDGVLGELYALQAFGGERFCKLYAFDATDCVWLEEAVLPGTDLWAVQSLSERVHIFASVFDGLHSGPKNPERFPAYGHWVDRITGYMAARGDWPELRAYMEEAKRLFHALEARYNGQWLLHGDLHQENILLGENNQYKLIDPKGVTGDALFDLPRFLINEHDSGCAEGEKRAHTTAAIKMLSHAAGYPACDLAAAYCVEMTMANCWSVESGEMPDMEGVRLAHDLVACMR